ncbi:Proton pump-interactor 1 [Linum perenne]
MGVEVVTSDVVPVTVEAVNEVDKSILHEKENGKLDKESGPDEAIKFGSHEKAVENGDKTDVANPNLPRNAIEEWPAPKQIHTFYFIRCRPYEDPKTKAKIDQIDKEITKRNEALTRVNDRTRAKRDDRAELIAELRALKTQGYEYRNILDEKRKEMQPLQQALGKLRNNNGAGRGAICSSEEELNELIYSMQYHIQHESIPLSEEKQILREIKQLEGTREKVIANAAVRAKIQDSLGQKEAIQDQVKHMNVDMDSVRKEHDIIWSKISSLKEKIEALDKEIGSIDVERTAIKLKRDEAFASLKQLRDQRDEGNSVCYNSRKAMGQAKMLAANKDVKAIEKLSREEGEKFMSQWNNDKAFRDDYEKRLLSSLDMRQLSRDGRIRNPGEKPLVVYEAPVPYEPQPVAKAVKKPEEPKSAVKKEALPAKKVAEKVTEKTAPQKTEEIEEEVAGLEIPQKAAPAPVDEAKLKEQKREEEIAKAKLAMERKKKLAEKAAAKAAKRAEKEAEKKLKEITLSSAVFHCVPSEREKKQKKKAGVSATNDDEKEADEVVEAGEEETGETKEAAAPVAVKEKARPVRYRNRGRVLEAVPKALLKKKKSTNYWLWAVPVALVAVLMVFLGYLYLLEEQ